MSNFDFLVELNFEVTHHIIIEGRLNERRVASLSRRTAALSTTLTFDNSSLFAEYTDIQKYTEIQIFYYVKGYIKYSVYIGMELR